MQEIIIARKKKALYPPILSSTMLLMHFDNNWNEELGNTVTSTGTFSSDIALFGGGSARFGSGQRGIIPPRDGLYSGLSEATIEAWVYKTGNPGFGTLLGQGTAAGNQSAWDFSYSNGYDSAALYYSGSGTRQLVPVIPKDTIPLNQWVHLALVWVPGNITAYVNGISQGAKTIGGWIIRGATDISLGNNSYNSTLPFPGYIEELRLSNKAMYTGNFTPQQTPFG